MIYTQRQIPSLPYGHMGHEARAPVRWGGGEQYKLQLLQ